MADPAHLSSDIPHTHPELAAVLDPCVHRHVRLALPIGVPLRLAKVCWIVVPPIAEGEGDRGRELATLSQSVSHPMYPTISTMCRRTLQRSIELERIHSKLHLIHLDIGCPKCLQRGSDA